MAKADSIGKGLGGFFSSPFGLGLLALGAIFIFRDKISEFFQSGFESIGSGLGDINIQLPSIELPSVELPSLPPFEFPSLPDIPIPVEVLPLTHPGEGLPNPADDPTNPTPFDVGIIPELFEEGGIAVPVGADPTVTEVQFGTTIAVPPGDELGFGGGPSFIGGTTTFGENLVDTLGEVLSIFPGLTASQAADALAAFPGLTGSQFALIDPDIINITGG